MNEDISRLLNLPGATVVTWCSFCNRRQSNGSVEIELMPGTKTNLPICDVCIAQAKQEGFEIALTNQED